MSARSSKGVRSGTRRPVFRRAMLWFLAAAGACLLALTAPPAQALFGLGSYKVRMTYSATVDGKPLEIVRIYTCSGAKMGNFSRESDMQYFSHQFPDGSAVLMNTGRFGFCPLELPLVFTKHSPTFYIYRHNRLPLSLWVDNVQDTNTIEVYEGAGSGGHIDTDSIVIKFEKATRGDKNRGEDVADAVFSRFKVFFDFLDIASHGEFRALDMGGIGDATEEQMAAIPGMRTVRAWKHIAPLDSYLSSLTSFTMLPPSHPQVAPLYAEKLPPGADHFTYGSRREDPRLRPDLRNAVVHMKYRGNGIWEPDDTKKNILVFYKIKDGVNRLPEWPKLLFNGKIYDTSSLYSDFRRSKVVYFYDPEKKLLYYLTSLNTRNSVYY